MKTKLISKEEIDKDLRENNYEFDPKGDLPKYFLSKDEIKELCYYQHHILAKISRIRQEKQATRSLKHYFKDWEENIKKLNNLMSKYKDLEKLITVNISARTDWTLAFNEVTEEIKEIKEK